MATHLCAFYKFIDSPVLTPLDAVVDDVLTRPSPDRFMVPSDVPTVNWVFAAGTHLTRAQIISPTLEVKRMSLDIIPHRRGSIWADRFRMEIFVPPTEISLTPTELFMMLGAEDGGGATPIVALVCLKPTGALPAMPAGDLRVVRAFGTASMRPFEWTTFSVTFEKDLEPGTYALVGFYPISATCIGARVLLTGQVYRPGVVGLQGPVGEACDFDMSMYQKIQFYNMGTFTHITPPQFQFLCSASDTSQTIIMYLIKTA